jgi:hypothetical protein
MKHSAMLTRCSVRPQLACLESDTALRQQQQQQASSGAAGGEQHAARLLEAEVGLLEVRKQLSEARASAADAAAALSAERAARMAAEDRWVCMCVCGGGGVLGRSRCA